MGGDKGFLRVLLEAAHQVQSSFRRFPDFPWCLKYATVPVKQAVRGGRGYGRRPYFRPHSDYYHQAGHRRFYHPRSQCRGFSSGPCFFMKQAWIGQPFWRPNPTMAPRTSLKAVANRTGLNLFIRDKSSLTSSWDDRRRPIIGYTRLTGQSVLKNPGTPIELLQWLWKPSQFANGKHSVSWVMASRRNYSSFGLVSRQQTWVKEKLHSLAAFAIPQDTSEYYETQTMTALKLARMEHSQSKTQDAQELAFADEESISQVETSVVDFDLKPHLTLSSVGELTEDSVKSMSDDVEAFITQLRDTMADIKRMASLGELPVSIENGVVKVHFPNADTDKVHTLLSDVEVTRGVVLDTTPESEISSTTSSYSESDDLLSNSVLSSDYDDARSYVWGDEMAPALTNATSEYLESEVLVA